MARAKQFGKELDALGTVLDAVGGLEENEQRFVMRTAIERLGLSKTVSLGKGGGGEGVGDEQDDEQEGGVEDRSVTRRSGGTPTPKQFLKEKRPLQEVQRIAVLAYYLTHHMDTPHFKTRDLSKLNTDAAGLTFSNPTRAVDDATRQSGFLTRATGGNEQITPLGEEVVEALPDQEAVRAAIANFKPARRKKSGRKKAAARRKG